MLDLDPLVCHRILQCEGKFLVDTVMLTFACLKWELMSVSMINFKPHLSAPVHSMCPSGPCPPPEDCLLVASNQAFFGSLTHTPLVLSGSFLILPHFHGVFLFKSLEFILWKPYFLGDLILL